MNADACSNPQQLAWACLELETAYHRPQPLRSGSNPMPPQAPTCSHAKHTSKGTQPTPEKSRRRPSCALSARLKAPAQPKHTPQAATCLDKLRRLKHWHVLALAQPRHVGRAERQVAVAQQLVGAQHILPQLHVQHLVGVIRGAICVEG
eukprot:365122-Chlamydomonas_euryale.AAC.52